ncbi:hypothetical protein GTO27_06345, partial [Candidatus Bathyarchaeota archaeon]|nr:hypothetical protein [Candidatus Bathyarchaeota archaeon]
ARSRTQRCRHLQERFLRDITKVWIEAAEGKIVGAKCRTQGCAASIACGSVLADLVRNKTVEEALRIKKDDIISALN